MLLEDDPLGVLKRADAPDSPFDGPPLQPSPAGLQPAVVVSPTKIARQGRSCNEIPANRKPPPKAAADRTPETSPGRTGPEPRTTVQPREGGRRCSSKVASGARRAEARLALASAHFGGEHALAQVGGTGSHGMALGSAMPRDHPSRQLGPGPSRKTAWPPIQPVRAAESSRRTPPRRPSDAERKSVWQLIESARSH
jgi:hypothetical protein